MFINVYKASFNAGGGDNGIVYSGKLTVGMADTHYIWGCKGIISSVQVYGLNISPEWVNYSGNDAGTTFGSLNPSPPEYLNFVELSCYLDVQTSIDLDTYYIYFPEMDFLVDTYYDYNDGSRGIPSYRTWLFYQYKYDDNNNYTEINSYIKREGAIIPIQIGLKSSLTQ